ncbi:MAG: DUF6273 domain-containing protein [Defluviitaleaceae bacterium]|nr:DUF6273 domain-containing protein [Defluviitaleaceae bacterium]
MESHFILTDTYPQFYNYTITTNCLIDFGSYTWRVLDLRDECALVISEKVVCFKYYNNVYHPTSWRECSMRRYLNSVFYHKFWEEDKKWIETVQLPFSYNPWYAMGNSMIGMETIDKIFLLSVEEVVRYFGDSGHLKNKIKSDEHRYMVFDEHNHARLAYDECNKAVPWVLRSPGIKTDSVLIVHGAGVNKGAIEMGGFTVTDHFGVRPAMWLNLRARMQVVPQEVRNVTENQDHDLYMLRKVRRW